MVLPAVQPSFNKNNMLTSKRVYKISLCLSQLHRIWVAVSLLSARQKYTQKHCYAKHGSLYWCHEIQTAVHQHGWSRMPCGLTRRAAAASFLGSRVRIPVRAWMLVSCVCCVTSGLCDALITLSDDSYRVFVSKCVRYRNFKNEAARFGL